MAKFSIAVIIVAATIAAAQTPLTPPEYDAAILRALSLPVRDALRGLDSLSRVQGAPGWVRAKSLKLLGDHQFIKADYKKAADFYQQASKFDNSSLYRLQYALALAADGKPGAARDILNAIAADGADIMSGEASLFLQEIAPSGQPPVPFTPPSAPQTARVDDRSSAPVNQQSTPSAKDESKSILTVQVQQAASGNAINNIPPATQVQQAATNSQEKITLYTVQVGAFGSKENADNLVKKLSGAYSDIAVSPTESGGQTLYRVRVGTFQNREEANAFADKLITTAGLSARVFEK